MSLVCLTLAALWLAACSDKSMPCASLCKRAKTCREAVGDALVARLPNRSVALKHARRELRDKLLPGLLDTCPERCERLSRSKRWREKIRPCVSKTACGDFARCFVPVLEP